MNRPSRWVVVVLAVLPWATTSIAQTSFIEVTPSGNLWTTNADEDFWINAVAPADVDGDGDLDLAVIGFYVVYFVSATDMLVLFKNEGPDVAGNWVFSEVQVPLGGMFAGASDLAWGDYDGDLDPDLVVGSEGSTALYRNDAGTLVATSTVLPGYYEDSSYEGAYDLRSITWADVDNDNDLDLLIPSVFDFNTFSYSTKLLRNDGSDGAGGWVFTDLGAALDPTVHAQSAWADDDQDNDLDLFLMNTDPWTETGFVRRYNNDAGLFTGADLVGIKVEHGLADWGDADGDGDFDILVAGNIQEQDGTYATVLRIYQNGSAGYTAVDLEAPFPGWLDYNAATWADYDSDGDVDLLVTGSTIGEGEIVGSSEIYGNDGGVFTPMGVGLPAPIESIGRGGAFTWLDLDNDGDLDYLVAGAYYVPGGNGLVEAQIHLYRNGAPALNEAPGPPGALSATPSGGGVTLTWQAAADDHTPSVALTYDLVVLPSGESVSAGAFERLPEPGNVSAVNAWSLRGLAPGDYTWSVSAVDAAFEGGPTASGSFTIGTVDALIAAGPAGGGGSRVRRLCAGNGCAGLVQ